MSQSYIDFLKAKKIVDVPTGFIVSQDKLNPMLFDFQKAIVAWACKRGRAAIFADCGLGKTPMQLEWARLVCEQTGGNVLIVAPLAVSQQTRREESMHGGGSQGGAGSCEAERHSLPLARDRSKSVRRGSPVNERLPAG